MSKTLVKPKTSYELREVQVWNSEGELACANLKIEEGKVVRIEPLPQKTKSRWALLPAGVDTQTHLRVPGQLEKESPEGGLRAALYGGYSALLTMPNTQPVIDSPAIVNDAKALVAPYEKAFGVKVFWTAAITLAEKGSQLSPFRDLKQAGVSALTDDGVGVTSDDLMKSALEEAAKTNLPLLQHCEMPGHGGILAKGPLQERLGIPEYKDEPEWKMIERDLKLLEQVPEARYHILHLTTRKAMPLIEKAKKKGLKVSVEVSPHHLYFCSDDIHEENTSFKMNPPIRSGDDRKELQAALSSGLIDWVATDHAPHAEDQKGKDFNLSAFGTLGLETCLRALLSLWKEEKLSSRRLVDVWAKKPADFLGLDESYGRISEGQFLRGVLVDLEAKETEVKSSDHYGTNANSCFIRTKLPGKLLANLNPAGVFDLSGEGLEQWIL